MSTRPPVPATVTQVGNYRALVVPDAPATSPASVRDGCWVPVKSFKVGDKVSLQWHESPSHGLWHAVPAAS